MNSAFTQPPPTKIQAGLPQCQPVSSANSQVSYSNMRFLNPSQYHNYDQQNRQVITLPYEMMMQQQTSGNRLMHPQQFFIMSQNSDPYYKDTRYMYPMILNEYPNQSYSQFSHLNPEKLSTNVQGYYQGQSLIESPMPSKVSASQLLSNAGDIMSVNVNQISGHLPSTYNSHQQNHQFRSTDDLTVEQAALALLNASRLSQIKLSSTDNKVASNNVEEYDQKIVRNLNISQLSNNRLQSENQQYQQVLTIQEKSQISGDHLLLSNTRTEITHQKFDKQTLGLRRSPSLISTQCDSHKRKSPVSETLAQNECSPQGSDSYSRGAQNQPTDSPHFTNRKQSSQIQKQTMFSQVTSNKNKISSKNSHLYQNTISRIEGGKFFLNDVLILEKILDSDDLNDCVSIILNKERTVTLTKANVAQEINLQQLPSAGHSSTKCQSKGLSIQGTVTHQNPKKSATPNKCDQGYQSFSHSIKMQGISGGNDYCEVIIQTTQNYKDDEDIAQNSAKQTLKNDMKTGKTCDLNENIQQSLPCAEHQIITSSLQETRVSANKKSINENNSRQNSQTCHLKTGRRPAFPYPCSSSGNFHKSKSRLIARKTLKVVSKVSNQYKTAEKCLTLKRQPKSVNSSDMSCDISSRRHRQRKNDDQHNYLMNEFTKNPNWDKPTIQKLSERVGLKMSQIYKWNWDQQKKIRDTPLSQNTLNVI